MTNAVRLELAGQHTLVQAFLFGVAKTDLMEKEYSGSAIDAREVPRKSLDDLEAGSIEVIVDDTTLWIKDALSGDRAAFYAEMPARLFHH